MKDHDEALVIFQSGFAAGFNRAKTEERQTIHDAHTIIRERLKEFENFISDLFRRSNQDTECIIALQEKVKKLEEI